MDYNRIFENITIPYAFSNKENILYFDKLENGDKSARDELINHNIRLVIYNVLKKYSNSSYDKNELVSIGLIGLVKAVDTFDNNKGIEFCTYASKCINNELLMYFRKLNITISSLYEPVNIDGNLTLQDVIEDIDSDLVIDYENKSVYKEAKKIILELPYRDKYIILMNFGFLGKEYNQRDIAKKFNISQSYVSRLIASILKKIKKELEELGYIEKNNRNNITFSNLINVYNLSYLDATVISLRFGLIDNKKYSVKEISDFLNVSEEDINDIISNNKGLRKVLK